MIDADDDAQLLDRLRTWLRQTRDDIDALSPEETGADDADASGDVVRSGDASHAGVSHAGAPSGLATLPEVGMYSLVEEFTALRHEVKLQTKSARGLDEQASALVGALEQALAGLRSVAPREAEVAQSTGKSFALLLAELDEALERGCQQTERAVARLNASPVDGVLERLAEFHRSRGWFGRWWHAGYHARLTELLREAQAASDPRSLLAALLDGYRLIQKRLAQALTSQDITRIVTQGRPVDPELMVVVEVVEVADGPGGRVYDDVRRGYLWQGRLLKYAEVRATRAAGDRGRDES